MERERDKKRENMTTIFVEEERKGERKRGRGRNIEMEIDRYTERETDRQTDNRNTIDRRRRGQRFISR